MRGILASPFTSALSQNLQAGGSVRVDLCEGGKVCREVRNLWLEQPGEESKTERERGKFLGGTGVSLRLTRGPGGRHLRTDPQPLPKGRAGCQVSPDGTVTQFSNSFFFMCEWTFSLGKTCNPGLLVSFWVDEELKWQGSLFTAPGSAHGQSLSKSAGGSETPKAKAQLYCAWTPLSQIGICEQVKYFNQLRCCYIHLSCKNLKILLVTVISWQRSDSGTGLKDEGTS